MGKKFAFVDEFGAFGFQFDKPNVSTHFIVTAIIVEEDDVESLVSSIESIRSKYFQKGEIKSSNIANNHRRRINILNEVKSLPFHVYTLVCDKRKIRQDSGLIYIDSFYKYINNLLYADLQSHFRNIAIYADARSGTAWRQSFQEYVHKKQESQQLALWDEFSFQLAESKQNVLVQLADLIGGAIAYSYDEAKKKVAEGNNYISLLNDKILHIRHFPEVYDVDSLPTKTQNKEWDSKIAEICYRRVLSFIKENEGKGDEDIKQQLIVLHYLKFRFMNNDSGRYISTKELVTHLINCGYPKMQTQNFRMKIIARLRDKGVILASSKTGYKIPVNETEIYDFVNHGKTIIMPMLSRLRKCHDTIWIGTNGRIDLFEKAEYKTIAALLEKDNKHTN